MALAEQPARFADHLRWWRHRRRLSQIELAGLTGVSAKHISFLETGRSQASREMVLHLARHLDVPARHQNDLLMAAGFAPAYSERALDHDAMADLRRVVALQLAHHEPFPAVCVDRHWNVMDANPAAALFLEGVAAELLEPRINVVRLSLHPDGLAPRVRNFVPYAEHLLRQLRAQAARTVDPDLDALLDEVSNYPGVPAGPTGDRPDAGALLPLQLDCDGQEIALASTIVTIGAPLDLTAAELAIEAFYPTDEISRAWLVDHAVATTTPEQAAT